MDQLNPLSMWYNDPVKLENAQKLSMSLNQIIHVEKQVEERRQEAETERTIKAITPLGTGRIEVTIILGVLLVW